MPTRAPGSSSSAGSTPGPWCGPRRVRPNPWIALGRVAVADSVGVAEPRDSWERPLVPPPELTALCAELQVGQRAAARLAHVDEGWFRRMCRGRSKVTPEVVGRLRKLVAARGYHQPSQS